MSQSAAAGNHKPSNKLAGETSPYLLQHAHNPVQWYPWGDEALKKAKAEHKPILLSIGYAACHWCHVMERESFEDEATAEIMNEFFINIKLDREERPDLDHIYMEAVQAMTGSGGWPLNVFLTPDKKPFYGGTYFPPKPMHGRSSWKEVLISLSQAWLQKQDEIIEQANTLTQHIANTGFLKVEQAASSLPNEICSAEEKNEIIKNVLSQFDAKHGGFGRAPKFLQTFSIRNLQDDYHIYKNDTAWAAAKLTLQKMLSAGIYDQVAGGIARYSTDEEWKVPHFEKMLYDNALLAITLSESLLIENNNYIEYYLNLTLQFLKREMRDAAGGYYAALDADSEGVEGKYYLYSIDELNECAADDNSFSTHFNISSTGNLPPDHSAWNNQNVLHATAFAKPEKLQPYRQILDKLLTLRNNKIRPGTDDKIILGWNALLIAAFCKAYLATGSVAYKQDAVALYEFIESNLKINGSEYYHVYTKKEAKIPAFLDDLSYYAHACVQLQQITGHNQYLLHALRITEYIVEHFSDEDDCYFYFTNQSQQDVVVRKKEFYDSAIVNSNAMTAELLYTLGSYFFRSGFKERCNLMLAGIKHITVKYPTSFGSWAKLLAQSLQKPSEIVVVGKNYKDSLLKILKNYSPISVAIGAENGDDQFDLLKGKKANDLTEVYICRDNSCQPPVSDIEYLSKMLK